MKRFGLAIIFIGLFYNASSQGLESLESYDFFTPFLRQAAYGRKSSYLSYFANIGGVTNYQFNNVFTKTNYSFERVAGNYYVNNFQFNSKNIFLQSGPGEVSDAIFRSKNQVAYYMNLADPNDSSARPYPVRFQCTYNYFRRNSYEDNQFFFDYATTAVSSFGQSTTTSVFAGVLTHRKEFQYGFDGKSTVMLSHRTKPRTFFGFGMGLLRSKIGGVDRWGNFKVSPSFALAGKAMVVTVSYTWTRELHLKFSNHELTFNVRFGGRRVFNKGMDD